MRCDMWYHGISLINCLSIVRMDLQSTRPKINPIKHLDFNLTLAECILWKRVLGSASCSLVLFLDTNERSFLYILISMPARAYSLHYVWLRLTHMQLHCIALVTSCWHWFYLCVFLWQQRLILRFLWRLPTRHDTLGVLHISWDVWWALKGKLEQSLNWKLMLSSSSTTDNTLDENVASVFLVTKSASANVFLNDCVLRVKMTMMSHFKIPFWNNEDGN